MQNFLFKIFKFNELIVVGVLYKDDGEAYHVLRVRKRGTELQIRESLTFRDSKSLFAGIDRKKPVILVIDGKGVLNRRIERNNESDTDWKKNLDYNNLYFTEYNTPEYDFLSFCRRKLVDSTIQHLGKELEIIDFYVGPLLSALLQPSLATEKVQSAGTSLLFNKNGLFQLAKIEGDDVKSYSFKDKILSQFHLPLYGAAIHFFLQQKYISKNGSDVIRKEEIYYKKAFNTLAVGMLCFFFISLLVSYCMIQYYSGENVELSQRNVYSNKTYKHIVELEDEKEQKIKLLKETGQLSSHFLSFYAYEICKSVPEGVEVDKIAIFPLTEELKHNKRAVLDSNNIVLEGTTANDENFNQWMGRFKDMAWIEKFEIISLKKDKKNNFRRFEVKIILTNV